MNTIKDSSAFSFIQDKEFLPVSRQGQLVRKVCGYDVRKAFGQGRQGLIFFSRKRADFKAELVLMAVKVLG
jgi:hypothetical protein